ncbi:MAG TPA: MazG family protein [Kineosporiaceae bacterium]
MSAPDGRIVLLVVSPRVAPGLLAWDAWQHVVAADEVLVAEPAPGWPDVLDRAGVAWQSLADLPVAARAGRLVEAAAPEREVLWLGSPDGDPGLTDALAERLAQLATGRMPPEVELITGSHDVPGARLLDLVAVMDRLRSPGGCPWDAEQTHESLLPYLLEEAHEVVDAVESGDRDHLAEELGDLLLQVVFHARLAAEHDQAPFDIDDVAAGIVAKLVRRHPHVFADVAVSGAEEVHANWEQIKAAEKRRKGLFDGIPRTLPALARAQKMLGRVRRSGAPLATTEWLLAVAGAGPQGAVARRLLDAVALAAEHGVDAEGALRAALGRLADADPGGVAPSASPGQGAEAGP